ncbi:MAG: helix-turn-helix domain-containing protein [Clostridiales bacterium]|nr:helix-turn-helix domain-containing protein [Clostridiales bacterium]
MSFKLESFTEILNKEFPGAKLEQTSLTKAEPVKCLLIDSLSGNDVPHYHDFIEVAYVTNSEATVTVNKSKYTVRSGDMLVLIPGDVHTYSVKSGCKLACIQADTDFLFSTILSNSDLHYSMPYTLSRKEGARIFRATELDDTDIPRLIYRLFQESTEKKSFYKLAMRADLSSIALHVFRTWDRINGELESEDSKRNGISSYRLTGVLDAIEKEYMNEITAESMAKKAGMSYSYFSRYFKSTIGHTFSEYLNSVRIKAAEDLLINTDIPVSEVASKVGFANTSYFIAQFKKQLHITPKKYRSNFGKSDF